MKIRHTEIKCRDAKKRRDNRSEEQKKVDGLKKENMPKFIKKQQVKLDDTGDYKVFHNGKKGNQASARGRNIEFTKRFFV